MTIASGAFFNGTQLSLCANVWTEIRSRREGGYQLANTGREGKHRRTVFDVWKALEKFQGEVPRQRKIPGLNLDDTSVRLLARSLSFPLAFAVSAKNWFSLSAD